MTGAHPEPAARPFPDRQPRVAVVHDAFTAMGGGERVASRIARALDATLFAAAVRRGPVGTLDDRDVRTSFVQPLVARGLGLAWTAPLLPAAFARLDVGRAEAVVSSSAAFAHHVRVPGDAVHICYCHTPPRFLWEPDEYFHDRPLAQAGLMPGLLAMRRLDLRASRRVDVYLANSAHVAAKIRRVYGRDAVVVHPPTDTSDFRPTTERSGRFLVVSRLRTQKRIDLAVRAASEQAIDLDVVGDGPDLDRLRRLAGPTVRFLGPRPDDEVRAMMARCVAVIVPAIGDFGLTLVEAQASGRPPIAFAAGGALEIVEDGRTGFLFGEQTAGALGAAMRAAALRETDVGALVDSARRFDTTVFGDAIRRIVSESVAAARVARSTARGRRGPATSAAEIGGLEWRERMRAT